jgi:N-acetylmuramoyl-L-alanine amidase
MTGRRRKAAQGPPACGRRTLPGGGVGLGAARGVRPFCAVWPVWVVRAVLAVLAGSGLGLLGGCTTTTTPGGVPIDIRHASRGQDSRVLFLVIHYTVADLPLAIKVLTESDVSAHYLLTDETPPRIFRLVPEERRAWHSGPSAWKGHRQLNASSIGIEIVHPGFRLGPDGERFDLPFPPAQIDALIPLVRDIVARHQIRPDRILGHGEVSPQFKQDPGPTFPWRRLSELGITPPWPDPQRVAAQRALYEPPAGGLPDVPWFQEMLAQHGYAIEKTGQLDAQTRNVLTNFQMRYRPARHDGLPDAESAAILWVLANPLPGLQAPPAALPAPALPAARRAAGTPE